MAQDQDQHVIVSAEETLDLTTKGNATYVDVRTPQEYAAGHAPGAINVPVALEGAAGPSHDQLEPNPNFLEEIKKSIPHSSSGVILACGAGRRATRAANLLTEAGYTDLKVFKEGFNGWKAKGLPVDVPEQAKE